MNHTSTTQTKPLKGHPRRNKTHVRVQVLPVFASNCTWEHWYVNIYLKLIGTNVSHRTHNLHFEPSRTYSVYIYIRTTFSKVSHRNHRTCLEVLGTQYKIQYSTSTQPCQCSASDPKEVLLVLVVVLASTVQAQLHMYKLRVAASIQITFLKSMSYMQLLKYLVGSQIIYLQVLRIKFTSTLDLNLQPDILVLNLVHSIVTKALGRPCEKN